MQLKFRGVSYDYQSISLASESRVEIGKYRGVKCFRTQYSLNQLTQPSHNLIYRGVAYVSGLMQPTTAPIADGVSADLSVPVNASTTVVRSSRHQKLSELDKIHNAYLMTKLEQRLAKAQTDGNQNLISQLEKERKELV